MYGKLNFYLLPQLLSGYESIRKAPVNPEYAKFSLPNVIKNLPGHCTDGVLMKIYGEKLTNVKQMFCYERRRESDEY